MPVIARVGRKSLKARGLILSIYLVLILGSVTMVYPFWIMLAGSIASGEAYEFTLFPSYLYSDSGMFEAHLWRKYYRYAGPGDIEWQWKVAMPPPYDSTDQWKLIPGVTDPSKPGTSLRKVLVTHFCAQTLPTFCLDYESIGSPKKWTSRFERIVKKHYPFAVKPIRSMVEAGSPFILDRQALLGTVEPAFSRRLDELTRELRLAGFPDGLSAEFGDVMRRYPDLAGQQSLRDLMHYYSVSRKPDLSDERVIRRIEDYDEFRLTLPVTHREAYYSCAGGGRILEGNREFKKWIRHRYSDLRALKAAYGTQVGDWQEIGVSLDYPQARHRYIEDAPEKRDWAEWKSRLPAEWIRPAAIEYWWSKFLEKRYGGDIEKLNAGYGTHYLRFFDIPLSERVPRSGPARADWREYVRSELALQYIRFDGGRELWRQFLHRRVGSVDQINSTLHRSWERIEEISLPYMNEPVEYDPSDPLSHVGYPPTVAENNLLLEFVASEMPLEHIRVVTPENLYRGWVLKKYGSMEKVRDAYGVRANTIGDLYFPMQAADWKELTDNYWGEKREMLTRSYRTAMDVVLRQKRSLLNTAVYCTAVVLFALIVNPMCAYALSRFGLPGAYNILLFLLATMAFPAEVTMIPNFLLLKSFPLLRIVCIVAGFLTGGALAAVFGKHRSAFYPLAGAVIGAILGGTVVTGAAVNVAGITAQVSLLNTYWALILPGMASGYSIFILKGFFDSLPPELYEAGVMDGAGELRLFWQITLPMSKPVLAVIALWSFTAAYGSFMWAMIICQDPKMWTLMVHIYQLQLLAADICDYYAILVLASIPTLLVFILAQKVILKGIILPSYK